MPQKTILLISPYYKEPHRWMVSSVKLAELWQQLGYKVIFVCMGHETSVEEVSDTLTIHRRKDLYLKDPLNTGICPGFAWYVFRLANKTKPDLIVINKILFWSSLSMFLLRATGHKVLLLTDTLVGMTWWPRTLLPKILAAVSAWVIGWPIMLLSRKFVTFHPQPPTLLSKLGVAKKTIVIPTGIDSNEYQIDDSKKSSDDNVTITYVGRLESVKRVDDFLYATTQVKKDFPGINIQVVGWYPSTSSGQVNHPLVKQYQDQVTFTGLRDDIPQILLTTDIFVLPSLSEGLSNALMEAMASGCACIAGDTGGNKYLIQNGVSGFLYPPGDRAALASHIRRLIEDTTKRKMLGQQARERIEKIFDWKVVGKQYQELFSKLIT